MRGGMHGSGMFHPEVIQDIKRDTNVEFKFSVMTLIDYGILGDEIVEQLQEAGFDCECYALDDVYVTIYS